MTIYQIFHKLNPCADTAKQDHWLVNTKNVTFGHENDFRSRSKKTAYSTETKYKNLDYIFSSFQKRSQSVFWRLIYLSKNRNQAQE